MYRVMMEALKDDKGLRWSGGTRISRSQALSASVTVTVPWEAPAGPTAAGAADTPPQLEILYQFEWLCIGVTA